MTTLMLVDRDEGSTKSEAVTLRLRQELARKGLSVSAVARKLGTTQARLSRRMTGETPWDVNELDEFCTQADISFIYVATGIKPVPDAPGDAYLIRK
ncbi:MULTISPECIES: helix-turn-helix domain-containing protein [Mycobacteroides]|uniref:helix-turn-helix domain-containing protein n=1 Tax=Mycobacteroides TaxID=670516 RepID=UPI000C2562B9|nr:MULTISPECIES: helix-turn-helix transcriptional regulator [Mycobacteroides]MBV0916086.1 helix-turn-helix domain-containing protein [Mycobacteroides chelonae]